MSDVDATPEPLLPIDWVAHRLSVSRDTVRAYVDREKLPHIRLGSRLRFEREAVERWISDRRTVIQRPIDTVTTAPVLAPSRGKSAPEDTRERSRQRIRQARRATIR